MRDSQMQGTREPKNYTLNRASTREPNGRHSRDVGLNKRLFMAAATFTGSTLSDASGGFLVFKVFDRITIVGTSGGLNNGDRLILSVTSFSITCDWPFKTEGPTSSVEIRTP